MRGELLGLCVVLVIGSSGCRKDDDPLTPAPPDAVVASDPQSDSEPRGPTHFDTQSPNADLTDSGIRAETICPDARVGDMELAPADEWVPHVVEVHREPAYGFCGYPGDAHDVRVSSDSTGSTIGGTILCLAGPDDECLYPGADICLRQARIRDRPLSSNESAELHRVVTAIPRWSCESYDESCDPCAFYNVHVDGAYLSEPDCCAVANESYRRTVVELVELVDALAATEIDAECVGHPDENTDAGL